jgi:hypothetical protein
MEYLDPERTAEPAGLETCTICNLVLEDVPNLPCARGWLTWYVRGECRQVPERPRGFSTI